MRYLKFNGVLEEVLERYPEIDLVGYLQQKLEIPEFKAKELAARIEKDYCDEVSGKVKQNLEKPIILERPRKPSSLLRPMFGRLRVFLGKSLSVF